MLQTFILGQAHVSYLNGKYVELRWEESLFVIRNIISLFAKERQGGGDSGSYVIRYFSTDITREQTHVRARVYREEKIRELSARRTPLCLPPHYKLRLRKLAHLAPETASDDDDRSNCCSRHGESLARL